MSIEVGHQDGDERPGPPRELPEGLPVLPLRETVPFPDTLIPLAVGQERSVKLVNDVLGGERMLAMVASRDPDAESPGPDDLYDVGVAGTVARMLKVPDGTLRILVQGSQRVRLTEYVATEPYLVARIVEEPDVVDDTPDIEALARNVQATFAQIVQDVPYLPEELQIAVANLDDPGELSYMIAGALRIKTEERQQLLEERNLAKRLRRLSEILAREAELISIGSRIQSQVQSEMEKGQREYFLRQQLKAIQDELGETDEQAAEANELRERMEEAELPDHVRKQAERELQRFERLPPQSAEHGVIRTYLEWILELPWTKSSEDKLDLEAAREQLDRDHYDIEKVKDRILEFLAVRKLKPDARSGILCFVGPPGVGKTSLGKSVAAAMGRTFERISVGGVRDESEIRGHRRTYIGAIPGTIVRALRDAAVNNPVLMIDEIDKMGADFRGDPASAMLEVLDPEQNSSFRDHYLDLPFDLSNVFFICTANQLDPVPRPLIDRMEIIELSGYTEEEKLEIAKRYLVPRQVERNGLTKSKIEFSGDALKLIIEGYTREAGVRNLEREIGALCRKVAREYAEGRRTRKKTIRPKHVVEYLGKRRFQPDVARRTGEPGVATGLAWTPAGGDVLFVEATSYPGEGKLQVTGQLGDVMKESALAALSYVKRNVAALGDAVPDDWFRENDVHVHVPAGAIPKDGPSAGITMATALSSLVSGRPVRSDTAMTGEITLTGKVLPIGGLKEKALAAQRA
ncbi:MAG: ATP-dependent Lon protease, partial [Gaiellaceae bacterium]|nr:ATP-dependent Lon protease [Gaiellaceae bacterium]